MNIKMFNKSIIHIPTIGILAFSFTISEPLSTNLKGLQQPYIVTASMVIITMILTYRIYLNIISYVFDIVLLNFNNFKQIKINKVIPIGINQIENLSNKKSLTTMDLQKVGDVYVEAKNNIEDDEVTNNNDNSKDLSDFEIAMLKNKKDKKEESEKVKTSIKQFVFGKFANMDIKEEVANSFIEDIYKFNDLHDPSFINVIKIETNIPLKKLAEIAHFVGKSLKWSGDEIAIFCKYAFKESFKNWEIESIKRIASSELSNKKSKK